MVRIQNRLPDEGVVQDIDEHFYLFHHCTLHSVNDEEVKRLLEYGIRIKKGPFTESEDARIYKNWARACEKFGLDYDHPFYMLGKGAVKESKGREHLCLLKGIPFWPTMCHGLIERSAKQVYSRMETLFDPDGWDSIKGKYTRKTDCNNFTEEEDDKLLELHETFEGHWRLISLEMKRSEAELIIRYRRVTMIRERDKNLDQSRWKGLWTRAMENEKWAGTNVEFYENIFLKRTLLPKDWEYLAKKMGKTPEIVQKAWKNMCKRVAADVKNGVLIEDAVDQVIFEHAKKITLQDMAVFMSILRKMIPKDAPLLPRRNSVIDFSELNQRRLDAGITGFHTHSMNDELQFLYQRVNSYFLTFDRHIGRRLKLHLMARDVLRIMFKACSRSKSNGTASRNTVIEETIRFIIKRKDPNWIPPYKFKKYVTDDDLLPLFQDGNNSELFKKKHYQALVAMFTESDVSDVEESWAWGVAPSNSKEEHEESTKKKRKRKSEDDDDHQVRRKQEKNEVEQDS